MAVVRFLFLFHKIFFFGGGLFNGELNSPGIKKFCWGSENFVLNKYIDIQFKILTK